MGTERGTPCPIPGCTEKTEVVALVPMVKGEQVIYPHLYSVCMTHYKEQWATVYSAQFNGQSYDEYLKGQG